MCFHSDTISSAVLNISDFNDDNIHSNTVNQIQNWFIKIARPIAVIYCKELYSKEYLLKQSSLQSIISNYILNDNDHHHDLYGKLCVLLTHSPISHAEETLKEDTSIKSSFTYQILQLGELTSERQLIQNLNQFYNTNNQNNHPHHQILIIQCDPIICSSSLIHHARYLCNKERNSYIENKQQLLLSTNNKDHHHHHIIFLIPFTTWYKTKTKKIFH